MKVKQEFAAVCVSTNYLTDFDVMNCKFIWVKACMSQCDKTCQLRAANLTVYAIVFGIIGTSSDVCHDVTSYKRGQRLNRPIIVVDLWESIYKYSKDESSSMLATLSVKLRV